MEALADCLETLRRGDDLDATLSLYPQYREELEVLLQVVSLVRPLKAGTRPSPDFVRSTRGLVLRRIEALERYRLGEDAALSC